MKQFAEHVYRIVADDDGNNRQYFLNDMPHEYISPEKVSVGSMVFFDKYNESCGIVVALRNDNYFQLYDVFHPETETVVEVAEFRVYRVT